MTSSLQREGARRHIAVTGGSGLIGTALIRQLRESRHQITQLVRRPAGAGEVWWDPAGRKLEPAALGGVDALITLGGENGGARWTAAGKRRIGESGVNGPRLLSQTIARLRRPPPVLISVSAVGIYGDRGDEILTEAAS